VRHSADSIDQANIAATMTRPSASANTGSVVATRQPPHDSVTSPVWSATHAAPAAASAINTKNRTIRIMEILLPNPIVLLTWLGERGHGIGRKLTGRGKRGIARVGLVEPGLRGRAVGH
jgi:hypothetical protein